MHLTIYTRSLITYSNKRQMRTHSYSSTIASFGYLNPTEEEEEEKINWKYPSTYTICVLYVWWPMKRISYFCFNIIVVSFSIVSPLIFHLRGIADRNRYLKLRMKWTKKKHSDLFTRTFRVQAAIYSINICMYCMY